MCKHILNTQVAVRAPCCKKWFDCPECHEEKEDHELERTTDMVLACKKCRKVFRKEMENYEKADEYCPSCDNHYVIEAKTKENTGKLVIEFKTEKGHENKMFVDEREKGRGRVLQQNLWDSDESD